MAVLRKKYRANSLVEIIIATVILSILVVIVFQVFNNLMLQAYMVRERKELIDKNKTELSLKLRNNEINLPYKKSEKGYTHSLDEVKEGELTLYTHKIVDSLGRVIYQHKWYEKKYNSF